MMGVHESGEAQEKPFAKSGSMNLQDFERLWPERDRLDPDTRAALEREMGTSRDAKAFASGGDWVRQACRDLGEEQASPDFAYRMGVYARNHLTPDTSLTERPWFRWSAVSAGLVTGALLMMLVVGGPVKDAGVPQAQLQDASQESLPAALPVTHGSELATANDSLMAEPDSSLQQPNLPQPNWELQRVSTTE